MTALSGLQADIKLPYEQEFELYHNAFSLCSMKVRLCLAELGIPYRSHHVDLIETGCYENVRPAFRAINPDRTVPVLVHNGHPVYQSHEQIRYAAQAAPAGAVSLVPESATERGIMEQWIDLSSLTDDPIANMALTAGNAIPGQTLPLFMAMIERIPYHLIFEGFLRHFDRRRPVMFTLFKLGGLRSLPRLPPFSRLFTVSREHMHRHLDALEAQLASRAGPWLLGETYSLADVSWLVILERLRQADAIEVFIGPAHRPACHRYWESLQGRPAYHRAILEQQHPLVDYGTKRIIELKRAHAALRDFLEER